MALPRNDPKKEKKALRLWNRIVKKAKGPSNKCNYTKPKTMAQLAHMHYIKCKYQNQPQQPKPSPPTHIPLPLPPPPPTPTPTPPPTTKQKPVPQKQTPITDFMDTEQPKKKRQETHPAQPAALRNGEIRVSAPKKLKVENVIQNGAIDNNKMQILINMLEGTPFNDSADNTSTIANSSICFQYFSNICKKAMSRRTAEAEVTIVDEKDDTGEDNDDDIGGDCNINDEIMNRLILECEVARNNSDPVSGRGKPADTEEEKKTTLAENIMTMNSLELCSYEHEKAQMREPVAGEEPCINGINCVVKTQFGFIMKANIFPSQLKEINKTKRNDFETNPCVCCAREAIDYQATYVAVANSKNNNRIVIQQHYNALGIKGQYNYHAAILPTGDVYACVKNNWERMSVQQFNGIKHLVQDEDYYRVPLSDADAELAHSRFMAHPSMLKKGVDVPLIKLTEEGNNKKKDANFLKGVPQKKK